jgi:hypothetical protein
MAEIAGENPGSPETTASRAPEYGLQATIVANPRRTWRLWKGPNRSHVLAPAAERGSTNGSDIGTPEQCNSAEPRSNQHFENRVINACRKAAQSADGQITEVDFAELEDGTLVELVENPESLGRECFAVCKDGEIRFVETLERDG